MDGNLNEKVNGEGLVVVKSMAINAIRHGECTRLVSFVTESKVYRTADAARAMRDGVTTS